MELTFCFCFQLNRFANYWSANGHGHFLWKEACAKGRQICGEGTWGIMGRGRWTVESLWVSDSVWKGFNLKRSVNPEKLWFPLYLHPTSISCSSCMELYAVAQIPKISCASLPLHHTGLMSTKTGVTECWHQCFLSPCILSGSEWHWSNPNPQKTVHRCTSYSGDSLGMSDIYVQQPPIQPRPCPLLQHSEILIWGSPTLLGDAEYCFLDLLELWSLKV